MIILMHSPHIHPSSPNIQPNIEYARHEQNMTDLLGKDMALMFLFIKLQKSYYMMNSLYYLWLKRLFLELDIINNTPPSLIPNVYVKLICFLKRTTYTHLLARSSIFFLRFMYWKRITKAEGRSIYGTVLISQVGTKYILGF